MTRPRAATKSILRTLTMLSIVSLGVACSESSRAPADAATDIPSGDSRAADAVAKPADGPGIWSVTDLSLLPDADARTLAARLRGTVWLGANGLGGVTVCIDGGSIPCDVTHGNGAYDLVYAKPESNDYLIKYSRVGYLPVAASHGKAQDPKIDVTVLPDSALAALTTPVLGAGKPWDPTTGAIVVRIYKTPTPGDGLSGATVELDVAKGVGPVYTTASLPDKALTATTTDGRAIWLDVPPSTYRVAVDTGSSTCQADHAWTTSTEGTYRVKVLAGFFSFVDIVCP